jgi:sugar phosphate isomerase/epimerase
MDVAWVIRGGSDPFKWIERYKDRISSVHVKDIAPAGQNEDEGGWADVGYGTVDWKKLYQAFKATKARHFILEHDLPSDLARCARRSIETIKTF